MPFSFCTICFENQLAVCVQLKRIYSCNLIDPDISAAMMDKFFSLLRIKTAHHEREHIKKYKTINHADTKSNKYFITLTAGGKAVQYEEAIKKVLLYKKFKVIDGFGVIELTKANEPHAHIYIESKNYVKHERIKRIWKTSFSQIKNIKYDNGIKKYCDKDKENTTLRDFCLEHNVKRVYTLASLSSPL